MAYGELSAEFYDLTKPLASAEEVGFYAGLLAGVGGPVLEAMCGSGRLLLPLLAAGVEAEGVDASAAMLARCRARGNAVLHQARLEDFRADGRYGAAVVALGSFQLFVDPAPALAALHGVLRPGGLLILDIFVPWERYAVPDEPRWAASRVAVRADGSRIALETAHEIDLVGQRWAMENRYRDEGTGACETEAMELAWYFPRELALLLSAAGFIFRDSYPRFGTEGRLAPRISVAVCRKM